MRKLLLVLPMFVLAMSCQNFTWQGQGSGLSQDENARGLKDIHQLAQKYETTRYWSRVRQRHDGRVNAFGRDLASIQNTIDRHLFNYSSLDPYVNYPSDSSIPGELGRFMVSSLAR